MHDLNFCVLCVFMYNVMFSTQGGGVGLISRRDLASSARPPHPGRGHACRLVSVCMFLWDALPCVQRVSLLDDWGYLGVVLDVMDMKKSRPWRPFCSDNRSQTTSMPPCYKHLYLYLILIHNNTQGNYYGNEVFSHL